MIDDIKAWSWLVAIVVNALFAWIVWSLRRKFVTRDDYEADRAKLRAAQASLAREHESVLASQAALTAAINNLPTAKDMHDISLSIAEMRGGMLVLAEKMDGQAELQVRVENQLNLLMRGHMRTES